MTFRREISALRLLAAAPIERVDPPDLQRAAWRVADQLRWAKTYAADI